MKREVKITKRSDIRTYRSNNGAEKISRTIGIEWVDEERYGAETYSVAVDINGDVNDGLIDEYIKTGQKTNVSFFMSVREYNGRLFTNCHGYLPAVFSNAKVN